MSLIAGPRDPIVIVALGAGMRRMIRPVAGREISRFPKHPSGGDEDELPPLEPCRG